MHSETAVGLPVALHDSTAHSASSTCSKYYEYNNTSITPFISIFETVIEHYQKILNYTTELTSSCLGQKHFPN